MKFSCDSTKIKHFLKMKISRNILKTTILFLFIGMSSIAQQKQDIIGYWKSCDEDDNMVVRVQLDAKGVPVGHLVGFQRDDGTWEENKLKKGIKVMYNFKYDGALKWNKGKIYDPIAKRTYSGVIKLQSKDIIKAVGYWLFLWDDILYKRISLDKEDEPKS